MKKKQKLLASSYSLENIKKIISDYFYGSTITLIEVSNNEYSVSNKIKLLEHYKVIKKKNRFRFIENL